MIHEKAMHTAAPKIGPNDPRYAAIIDKQFNKRFRARPDCVRIVSSTEQLISVVEEAVKDGHRLVVTSGGHCLEGFVSDPDVRVIIDVSAMKGVYYDETMRAVAIEAGATVGEAFRALYETWGVVVPFGEYPQIGIGGHVAGGAFGFLCRQLGLAADYLYGVEVVVVDEHGHAHAIVATRDSADTRRDVWWAHTGGGGGNFGIVTRYWFRSLDATGDAASTMLPRAPASIATLKAEWDWNVIDRLSFRRLFENHGRWAEQNSDADSRWASLWTLLEVHRKQFGKIIVRGVSTAGAEAQQQFDEYIAVLSDGVVAPSVREVAHMTWLEFALNPFPDLFAAPPGGVSVKVKDALLKKALTERQIEVAYSYLTRADYDIMGGLFGLASYGGRVNLAAPDDTASCQRGAIFDMACTTGWLHPREETNNLAWVRAFYRELFADTGGVPVPNHAYDGTLINHPDTDLLDPTLNTSGVAWSTLYYNANYPRLQRIKAGLDPRNVFRHALSIRAGA